MNKNQFKESFEKNGISVVKELLDCFSKGLYKDFKLFEYTLNEDDINKYQDDEVFQDFLEDCKADIKESYPESLNVYISEEFFYSGSFCFFSIGVNNKKLKGIKNKIFFDECCSVILDKLRHDFREKFLDFYTFDYLPSIFRNATNNLFESISYWLANDTSTFLFSLIEQLSILTYEKARTEGLIYFLKKDEIPNIDYQFEFKKKIPFIKENLRLIRKVLELTNIQKKIGLVSDTQYIYGLTELSTNDAFCQIEFRQNNTWELLQNTNSIVQVKNIQPLLISEDAIKKEFETTYKRVFGTGNLLSMRNISKCIVTLLKENKGTILVISENAKDLITNFKDLSIEIEPEHIGEKNIVKLSSIDGAIIIDERSVCYGFGAILDGKDTGNGDPARGSRYNSSERFYSLYSNKDNKLLVFVLSDDGNYNIFPSNNYAEQIIKYLTNHEFATFKELSESVRFENPMIIRIVLRNMISRGIIASISRGEGRRQYYLVN